MSDFTIEEPGDPPPASAAPADSKFTIEEPAPEAPEPHTTAAGLAASAARGAAPYAAGATLGALAGAPIGGVGAIPGAAAGTVAVGLTDLAGAAYNPFAERFGWGKLPHAQELTDKAFDYLGIKRPSTDTERVAEAAGAGAGGAAGAPAFAKEVAETATSPMARKFAETMAQKPVKQMVSGATGATAAQTTANLGGGPVAQTVAGMFGGWLPFAPETTANLPIGGEPKAAALAAHKAGYVLPPGMASEEPSFASKVFGGEGGKIKLQQAASVRNQHVTNKLAAEDLGLPPDTVLTEKTFRDVREKAGQTYREVEQTIPEITTDATIIGKEASAGFKNAVAQIGGKDSASEKLYPGTMRSPEIEALRAEVEQHETVPTTAARQYVAKLRFDSNHNLRAVGDPKAHAFGLAQRQAADAVEGLIEANVKSAPKYFERKFSDALEAQSRVSTRFTEAAQRLTLAEKTLATNSDIYVAAEAMKAQRVAKEAMEAAEQSFEQANATVENWRSRLRTSQDKDANNQTLMDRFRAARTLMAKSYDVEGATNTATGDVSARGLWHLAESGKKLSGNLDTIANAAGAFRKAMQSPDMFGHAEDWSALDFFGVSASLIHGNVPVAAAIASRPLVRGRVLSPGYQGRMMHPENRNVAPPSMFIPPSVTQAPPIAGDQ